METTTETVANNTVSGQCLVYSWNQIVNLTTNYTTYIDPSTNESYYVYIGALTVLGQIDSYNLDYQCPPTGYNGVGPDCSTQPDTQLVILYIRASNNRLYGLDIILSGAPFPSVESLQDNQPPFGKASHTFPLGLRIQSNGYLKICKSAESDQCPQRNITNYKLPYPLPSNYGYGIFGIQAFNLVTNSTWIMDDPNQLLIVTAGAYYYYFNRTGFFLYDSTINQCQWFNSCNYQCEVYNYNSRFLDYAGQWLVTHKWGVETMKPTMVDAWIGNAIDAAGIFPVVMYTDKATGHYLGLDKLDAIPSPRMGATYWYIQHGNTTPRVSIENFHPNVVEASCTINMSEWMGIQNHGSTFLGLYYLCVISLAILIVVSS